MVDQIFGLGQVSVQKKPNENIRFYLGEHGSKEKGGNLSGSWQYLFSYGKALRFNLIVVRAFLPSF